MGVNKNNIAFVMPWHISERGGGAEVQANYLAQELASRGFQVSYVCQTTNVEKINTTEKNGFVDVYFLKPSGKFAWMDQNKYLTKLKNIKPDIIVQRLSSNVSYVIGNYCKKNHCKFVWMCTDNMSPNINFHEKKFKKYFSIKNTNFFKYNLFLTNAKIMDYFRNNGMKQIDLAFSQNDFQHKNLINNFNLKSFRMISGHPLPNKKTPSTNRFENKTILWCANMGKHKRPELFIELAEKMIKSDYKFIMVGGHNNKNYINQLLANKPKNLKVVGQVSFNDSLTYFNEASLFINTSISEGFSNTYIQAWLRGLPTLVFGADPNNVIKTNTLGFDMQYLDEAISKIEYLFSDIGIYKEISKNAADFAQENHSIAVMTDHFENTLKENI